MRCATTAHSSRSARNLGKMRPLEVSPTLWPARPIRCRPRVTDFGDSTCSTRSTAPMSMPSSRLEVATRHGSSPALSWSSITSRSSRASEPWCARAISTAGPSGSSCEASSLSRSASRSAPRRLLTNTIVDLCCADELEDLRVDRGPDRLARRLGARERIELDVGLLRLDHALDRHVDLQVERLAHAGVDDPARPLRADHEAADLLERVLGRGQADPLDGPVGRLLEPLERDRHVRAALGLGDGVDLVDDHGLDVGEDLARPAREHQVQRLGRGDQDVRRVARHVAPVLLRRVAGAHADADVGADPAQRRAQVLLDVVGERLQRRDVDEPGAVLRGLLGEPVRAPTGTRRASCRSRSARRSACARRWRSPATPAPGPRSARRRRG